MSKLLSTIAVFVFAIGSTHAASLSINQGIKNANSAAIHAMHKAHLELALKDILVAEADAKSGKVGTAEKAAAAAIKQIREAVAHHQHNAQLHQHHHTHLQAALADLQAAEKQLKTGSVGKAEHDLSKAATQVRESLAKHHQNKNGNNAALTKVKM